MANKTISILQKDGAIIAPFTNNLAAYRQLLKLIPEEEHKDIYSYSQVNRLVKEAGQSRAFTFSGGTLVIRKCILHKKDF